MGDNNLVDIEIIAKECGINSDNDTAFVIENINALETKYEKYDLVQLYNYFMTIEKRCDVLKVIISYSDKYRDSSTLRLLVDLLLAKEQLEAYNDKDDIINLKVLCAKAIANYKDTSVVGSLLYCLNNKNEHYKIRLACADSLGKIGDKFAVTPLIDLIQDEEEKSVYLKESAASALGELGDLRAIDPLVSILETKQGFLDKFSFLKERVIEALGKLNVRNTKVIKALKHSLMDSSPMVRINAIETIMNSDIDEAPDIIKPSLKDENEEVRKNALIAMYNLIGVTILEEVLSSDNYDEQLKIEAQDLINEYEDDDEE